MRQVDHVMGMPVSIDIPLCGDQMVFKATFDLLREIDKQFSLFKESSELTRYNKGELKENELSSDMKAVIKACKDWQRRTGGYFSAWYAAKFDPSGYVKGWAIKKAGEIVKKQGYGTFCIGAGGDILAQSNSDKVWNIGIQNPTDKSKILDVLGISNGALATSGNYERGKHIINPKTGKPANELLSVTVIGPDIITADVLATAAFAMGEKNHNFMKSYRAYKTVIISKA